MIQIKQDFNMTRDLHYFGLVNHKMMQPYRVLNDKRIF